jgi:hypothetical protein
MMLEASHPLVVTANNRVVTSVVDASGHVIDYYDVLKKLLSIHSGAPKS